MTPLAHKIVRELTLPLKDRSFTDKASLLPRMADVQCFEVSEIAELARDLGSRYPKYGAPEDLLFLPAPKTWLERKTRWGRMGFFLEEDDLTSLTIAYDGFGQWGSLNASGIRQQNRHGVCNDANGRMDYLAGLADSSEWLRAVLAMINTPRIIGRKQHMPHRGLEHKLLRLRGTVGSFPLRAWTEILLKVTPPHDAAADAPSEAHLTGRRALHFCRAHLRIRMGCLELVSAHWRGDPALGIKRSRYRVVPPSGACS